MEKRRKPLWLLVPIVLVFATLRAEAQLDPVHALKSMFVYNFVKHIQWPDDASTKIVQIGLIGADDGLMDAFEKMAKAKSTPAQQIVVKKTSATDGLDYQILYLASTQSADFNQVMAKIKQKPVVLVAEDDRFLQQGAFIAFKKVDTKLRFQINKEAFEKGGVKVSSTLISMASAM